MIIEHSTLGIPRQRQSTFPGAARGGTVTVRYWRIPFAITARLVVPGWSGLSATTPATLSCATLSSGRCARRRRRAQPQQRRRIGKAILRGDAQRDHGVGTDDESRGDAGLAAHDDELPPWSCRHVERDLSLDHADRGDDGRRPGTLASVTPTRACPVASVEAAAGWMRALIPVNATV